MTALALSGEWPHSLHETAACLTGKLEAHLQSNVPDYGTSLAGREGDVEAGEKRKKEARKEKMKGNNWDVSRQKIALSQLLINFGTDYTTDPWATVKACN